MAACWGALVLDTPILLEPLLVGLLSDVCLGAEFEETGPGRGRLTVYLGSQAEAHDAARRAADLLRRHGLDPEQSGLRVEGVEDGKWVERYQASLQPFPLGARFLIDPGGTGATAAGRRRIALVPGRAFGTGEHPTTRICAGRLEKYVSPGSSWVDLGCGSAILSLVARFRGARRVLALDVDLDAAAVARNVVRENRQSGAILVVSGSAESAKRGVWDGVVANIAASYFLRSAAAIAALLRADGTLIAAGFRAEEGEIGEVAAVVERAGLREIERDASDGWGVLVFTRGRPAGGD